ncbi:MAG: hypothetical protein HZB67_03220, partial [Candidatus Aenigmarchaeota archaeon]|nr:hypothetical protein [Candidatus Aenigmarchaeota archaeon]
MNKKSLYAAILAGTLLLSPACLPSSRTHKHHKMQHAQHAQSVKKEQPISSQTKEKIRKYYRGRGEDLASRSRSPYNKLYMIATG